MINLAPDLFENMTVIFMDITKCSKAFPASSVTKKLALIPFPTSNLAWYVPMYVCTTDEMTVTFSYLPPLTPSLCKSIVVPYVDINAKVTNFFPFCTIGISMYQKRILPYFIIPSTLSPQASSPLERSGRTEKSQQTFIP